MSSTPPLVQPYLFFNGRCDEALEFYKSAIGAEVLFLMRYKDSPEPTGRPDLGEKVMHSTFRVGSTELFASDGQFTGQSGFEGFTLSLVVPDDASAEKLFRGLSEGGQVRQALGPTFFATSFGTVEDRFGLGWMVIAMRPRP
jgi:PhnB protein